ncbi:hypothetical protein EGI26_20235 [Lacihabitans sp. CCS-44]|uniref:hypothetical protein n=1 Tax=Lacihabitans sp. CCS-44 TaxID=2487331 RepID=UPI0020CC3D99|nr:hypothetical protein [Lacihabitans sp. CCS-44]MCP9757496.1 hypothetical protein [Lacihabitans sp. CCS-44]
MSQKDTQNIDLSETEKSDSFYQNKVLNEGILTITILTKSIIEFKKQHLKVSPFVMSMKGAFQTKVDLDYKEELVKILSDKYL